ncbi:MAG: hypothetical protein V1918_10440, partial [Planctomycetota bacterium]
LLAFGVMSALGSYLMGYLYDRRGLRMLLGLVAAGEFLGILFLALFLWAPSPAWSLVCGAGMGATMSAVFPLTVVLTRGARGLNSRIRASFAIGGTYLTGNVFLFLAAWLLHYVTSGWILAGTMPILLTSAILALVLARRKGRGSVPNPG